MKESFSEAVFNLEFGGLSQPAITSIEFYFYFHLGFGFLSFCVRAKLTFDGEIIHTYFYVKFKGIKLISLFFLSSW